MYALTVTECGILAEIDTTPKVSVTLFDDRYDAEESAKRLFSSMVESCGGNIEYVKYSSQTDVWYIAQDTRLITIAVVDATMAAEGKAK